MDPEPEPVINWMQDEDEFMMPENTNKFQFDPENGGGRCRRLRNVSRIDHLRGGQESLQGCAKNLFGDEGLPEFRVPEDDEAMPF